MKGAGTGVQAGALRDLEFVCRLQALAVDQCVQRRVPLGHIRNRLADDRRRLGRREISGRADDGGGFPFNRVFAGNPTGGEGPEVIGAARFEADARLGEVEGHHLCTHARCKLDRQDVGRLGADAGRGARGWRGGAGQFGRRFSWIAKQLELDDDPVRRALRIDLGFQGGVGTGQARDRLGADHGGARRGAGGEAQDQGAEADECGDRAPAASLQSASSSSGLHVCELSANAHIDVPVRRLRP